MGLRADCIIKLRGKDGERKRKVLEPRIETGSHLCRRMASTEEAESRSNRALQGDWGQIVKCCMAVRPEVQRPREDLAVLECELGNRGRMEKQLAGSGSSVWDAWRQKMVTFLRHESCCSGTKGMSDKVSAQVTQKGLLQTKVSRWLKEQQEETASWMRPRRCCGSDRGFVWRRGNMVRCQWIIHFEFHASTLLPVWTNNKRWQEILNRNKYQS